MSITTRQGLIDYCLMQLGAPVINIEIAPEQSAMIVDEAIQYFNEYHYDGTVRDYLKRKITASVITVASSAGFQKDEVITGQTSNTKAIYIDSPTATTIRVKGVTGVFGTENIVGSISGTTTSMSNIVLGDIDNKWIPIGDDIIGVVRVLPGGGNSQNYLFDIQYQLRLNDLRDIYSTNLTQWVVANEYLRTLDFVLAKEKTFRFNRRMNKLFLDINWSQIEPDSYMVVECYSIVSDAVYSEMLNDIWLKEYATALMKKMWANNIRKYVNMVLPGNVQLNGQLMYDEAVQEIERLKQELLDLNPPADFFVG